MFKGGLFAAAMMSMVGLIPSGAVNCKWFPKLPEPNQRNTQYRTDHTPSGEIARRRRARTRRHESLTAW